MAVAENTNERVRVAGDAMAEMEALIQEHQRMIFALCYRMTGSVQDAEDLAQETFVQACRNYASFRHESRISSWLYRIAINRCLNWQTRRNLNNRLHEEMLDRADDASPGTDVERAQQVHEALLKLKPAQRAAVVLTVYDGLSHAEAAKLLDCSETTVSWRVFIARRLLKKWLKDLSPRRGNDR